PDYNLILHTAPLHQAVDGWNWRLEVVPRLYAWGGLDLGSGLVVNPLLPEQACQRLKASISRSG
ncbi:MAG: galactose-1-phosphate uridylyltransferase, partial [Planctomycetaceae bacterium]